MIASAYYGKLARHRVAGPFDITESIFGGGSSLLEHCHQMPYFTFTFSGSYRERCGTRSRLCTPGTAVAHPAFEMHSQKFAGDVAILLRISVSENEAEDAAEAALKSVCTRNPNIARAVSRMRRELAVSDVFSDTIVEGLAYELLAQLLLSTCQRAAAAVEHYAPEHLSARQCVARCPSRRSPRR